MYNFSSQQEKVILTGIAHQILKMDNPTFEKVNELRMQFGVHDSDFDIYELMLHGIKVALNIPDDLKPKKLSDLAYKISNISFKHKNYEKTKEETIKLLRKKKEKKLIDIQQHQ